MAAKRTRIRKTPDPASPAAANHNSTVNMFLSPPKRMPQKRRCRARTTMPSFHCNERARVAVGHRNWYCRKRALRLQHQCNSTGATMATKKTPAKKTTAKKTAVKKSTPRKVAAKKSVRKSGRKSGGALHNVARSIGSTLGTIAKKTSKAVEAAKQALPSPLNPGN